MDDLGKGGRVVLGNFSIPASARHMFMSAIAPAIFEALNQEVYGSSNFPRLEDGRAVVRNNAEHAAVESHGFQLILVDELFDAIPVPVRAAVWPLNGNMPPGIYDFGSNLFERIPQLAKQSMMHT